MSNFAQQDAFDVHWQAMDVNKDARAKQKHQRPICLWLTGLPASGKSTIANLLEKRLYAEGRHTYVLDGDNVRHGLSLDLGFSELDRRENIRRVSEVARLMLDAGLLVIVALVSPYQADRQAARLRFEANEFVEVFIDASPEICELRDPKGLYAKARRGALSNFTGLDGVYEYPVNPDIKLDTVGNRAEECVEQILAILRQKM